MLPQYEQPDVIDALFAVAPTRSLDKAFDDLADAVEAHIDLSSLLEKAGVS